MNRLFLGLLAAVVLTAAGCGGPRTGTVSGLVKLNGKPLAGGTITFHPATGDQLPVTVTVGTDGQFVAPDVPVGELRVGVASASTEEADARSDKEQGQGPKKPAPPKVPAKYADPLNSGLTFTLSGPTGEYTADLS